MIALNVIKKCSWAFRNSLNTEYKTAPAKQKTIPFTCIVSIGWDCYVPIWFMEHLIFTTAREPLIATEVTSVLSEHLKQNVNRDNRHDEKNFTVGSLKL